MELKIGGTSFDYNLESAPESGFIEYRIFFSKLRFVLFVRLRVLGILKHLICAFEANISDFYETDIPVRYRARLAILSITQNF